MWEAFRPRGRIRGRFYVLLVISVLLFSSYFLLSKFNLPESGISNLKVYSRSNDSLSNTARKSYIVNTTACKIPDLDPWDPDVLMLSRKCEPSDETDPECGEKDVRKWMYSQGANLLVNYTAIKGSGYTTNSIRCCYHVITRVEQSLEEYDMNADVFVKYSTTCHPINLYEISPITDEFIRVFCISNAWPLLNDVVYREYFAFAQLDNHALEKILKWKDRNEVTPPNIVILGLDTNSRLNSHRRLTKTIQVLEKLDAVEMFGYTKVAENTLPNTMAFLGGMKASEMESLCQKNEGDSFDNCPFLWKDFDRAGYLTGTAEEAPWACGFNYLRSGFVFKPTDFYYRPFTLALMKQPRDTMWFGKCVGRYLSVEMLFGYLNDILRRGSLGAPVFIHSWLSVFSHHCINSARFEDDAVARFIEGLDKLNTILIFMSDHGDRYGPFRETTLGWYEDKLPAMWIYISDNVRHKFPEWVPNLKTNSKRLTSHFDLYHTFVQILHSYVQNASVNSPKTKIGQSLLEPVPENRTCEDAGIPGSYCACTEPLSIDVNSNDLEIRKTLNDATNAATDYLFKVLPKECAKLSVKEVVSAKVMVSQGSSESYVMSFYTEPGDFLFEVTVKARGGSGVTKKFVVENLNDILRMNKITRKVGCVSSPDLERYCYCS